MSRSLGKFHLFLLKCLIKPDEFILAEQGYWFFFFFLILYRYAQGHIWACPPSEGDDYIFHCHPPDQKIPKPKRLQEWYRKMLEKAFAERILHDYKVRNMSYYVTKK